MINNYNTIDVKQKYKVRNINDTFNTLRIYTTLYHTYKLLYCKDKSILDRNNGLKEMPTSHSILLDLYYIMSHLFVLHRKGTHLDDK